MISIPDEIKREILTHAEEEYPDECCGILFGTDGPDIRSYVRMRNECVNDEKCRFFSIDPLKLYGYEKEYRVKGLEVLGFVHSHPDKKAVLSEGDERYMIPGMLYLIAGVKEGKCSEIRIWRKDQDGKTSEETYK